MKAILFDLDETLISHHEQLCSFIEYQYSHNTDLQEIDFNEWKEKFIELDENGYVIKELVYRTIISHFNLNSEIYDSLIEEFYSKFHMFVKPFKGSLELLQYLKQSQLKLGIVTNGGTEIQSKKIQQLNLHEYVDVILISEQENCEKPEPKIFNKALYLLDCEPEESYFVGDNIINDILGAKNVGMHTIFIENKHSFNKNDMEIYPDYSVKSLEELTDVLRNNLNNFTFKF
ncbi:HAD family hydrolase (plasmid) [Alkalihalophilus sp. As8PL]|uniref:HAD family hydrolase n=1 Tax=Alkalihalophilus sp. As8PL TaxID=3237103 RepID=A0AB39BNH3_9BACI